MAWIGSKRGRCVCVYVVGRWETYAFLKANTDGVVYVMAPTKYEKKPSDMPLARIVVGKISDIQMKLGPSTPWKKMMYI
jgi:hypothetical protein